MVHTDNTSGLQRNAGAATDKEPSNIGAGLSVPAAGPYWIQFKTPVGTGRHKQLLVSHAAGSSPVQIVVSTNHETAQNKSQLVVPPTTIKINHVLSVLYDRAQRDSNCSYY